MIRVSSAAVLFAIAVLAAGCFGGSGRTKAAGEAKRAATRGAGSATNSEIEGTYSMSASNAEIEAAPRHGADLVDNWGSFTLVLRNGRFRFSDRRPPGAQPSVGCRNGSGNCSGGTTTGRYIIRGTRIEFRQHAGTGDTPMGKEGDSPIVSRWSYYRGALTFHLITNLPLTLDAGPPLLYVKPWRRK
jgi:hypothetical protein